MGNCFEKEDKTKSQQEDETNPTSTRFNKRKYQYEDAIDPVEQPTGSRPQPSPVEQVQTVPESRILELLGQGKKIVRAIYDYEMTEVGDLPFKKGDVLEVLSEDGDWWEAINLANGDSGCIPGTYVMPEKSLDSYDWYHGDIPRSEAESRLLIRANPRGTFLIRNSQTNPGTLTLSVLDETIDERNVKERLSRHYRVKTTDAGGYFVTTKRQFKTLVELIQHYQNGADGLCHGLTKSCPKPNPVLLDISKDTKESWEVPRSEITLVKELGKGNFGVVYQGLWKKSRKVAVKTLREGSMSPQKFLEEAVVMKKLRHPRIVLLYAVCTKEEPIYIVTELMPNGSLLDYLKGPKGRELIMPQLINIGAQVADGMRYIEAEHFIHRDLAARNILVGECNNVKIGDFGLAKILGEDPQDMYTAHQGSRFPIKWTAPEAAIYGQFNIKSDVWAYGILLVEIVTYGAMPYPGMTNPEVLEELSRGFRHPEPSTCPPGLYEEVMLECWKKDPNNRPTFEHLYFTMIDLTSATEANYRDL